jgi:hypothetical protein
VLDDPEGCVCVGECLWLQHMVEIVVARAVVGSVRERRGLRAGLAGDVAEPEDPVATKAGRMSGCSWPHGTGVSARAGNIRRHRVRVR